ncbi:MAG: hypothetical protein KF688_16585 [Pirellulales bacterium]|nr:hypothetical protein [Pirellulales bacterium]
MLTTELVKVQDGNTAFAATLDAGSTNLTINGSLTVFGSFDSDVTIAVVGDDDSPASGASLSVGEGSTLGGTGEVLLRRTGGIGVAHAVFGSTGTIPATHGPEHTIRGEGLLNANLVNEGLILAEDQDGAAGSVLVIGNAIQNHGVIRTSASGTIRIAGSITQSASGRIVADGNTVQYQLGTVSGGTLEAENGGSFLWPVDGTIQNLTNNAPINVVTGATGIDLFVAGTGLTNNGAITINSNNMNGSCIITFQTTQTLDGSGEIVLNRWNTSGSPGATFSTSVGATVTQAAGHTIRGEGLLASALVNNGLVEAMDANGDGEGLLRVAANSNGSANATNNNIFRTTGNATIDLNSRLDQSATGRLIARDGGVVQFRSATLVGGSLETEGSGAAKIETSTDFENVANKGTLEIPGGGSEKVLSVRGTMFVNDGLVNVNSTVSGNARIRFTSSLELSGGGEIVLSRPIGASTLTIESGVTVTQAAGHTIRGRGQLLGVSGTLINNGTLAGTSSTEMMDVNVILTGSGLLRDVFIDGIHAPGNPQTGNPTASVPVEGEYNFGNGPGINSTNRLVIEIGGTTAGTEYDQLVSTDPSNKFTIRNTQTDLQVSLIDLDNGYVPTAGERFTIIDSPNPIVGMFQNISLPATGLGRKLSWHPIDVSDPTKLVLELAAVNFLDADFNEDGAVDGTDLALWQAGYGVSTGAAKLDGDATGDGKTDGADFLVWQRQFSVTPPANPAAANVPEPASLLLALAANLGVGAVASRANRRTTLGR